MVTPSPLEVLKRTIKSRQAREGLLLVAILALAATLRLWRLGEVGFRGDEAVYGGQAAVLADADGMDRHFILTSRGNSNFLLFQYVVSLAYRLFGVSDVAARAVAATFSTLTVLVVFAIAKALYGRRTALYAALLMALSGYAVTLGRVALLESASVFLFAMAMLFVAWWHQTQKKVWLYGFAAAAALTIQAKVTGSIVIPIFLGYLVLSGRIRRVSLRAVAMSLPVFLAFLFPALVQLAGHHGEFSQFLSGTVSRTSKVPWYYYAAKLATFEGPIIPLLWAGSLLLALKRREGSDLLPVTWALGVLLFYQLYPLKGFNYLLPVVPPLSLLAARLLASPPLVRRAGLLRPPALRAG
ncbi:MAG: ArnT family glycosyltransferase, partial [Candidatus Methylomirabilales bacterium]